MQSDACTTCACLSWLLADISDITQGSVHLIVVPSVYGEGLMGVGYAPPSVLYKDLRAGVF